MLLSELSDQLESLPGLGPRRAAKLGRLGVRSLGDLLTLVPRRYEDRSTVRSLVDAAQAGEGLVRAAVISHEFFHHGRNKVLKILLRDDSSTAALVCFGRNFLARSFPPGTSVEVFGQFELRYGEIQARSFEARVLADRETVASRPFMPVYPLTEGITQQQLRDAVDHALSRTIPSLEDELPEYLRKQEALPSLVHALRALHRPTSPDEAREALQRLVWGELFLFQLHLARDAQARRRAHRRARPPAHRSLVASVRAAVPFDLTVDQERVLQEIVEDLQQPWPMSRLLQGDVGSGKTLVALLAAVHAVERGEQVALLVPTELLARQHARSIGTLLRDTGIHAALVVGGLSQRARTAIHSAVAQGEVDVLIGTHALFAQGLEYANLGLVVIDEQHRFGVQQRNQLVARGTRPDVLMMSATPIPRSLALTAFGDSEVSTIEKLPPGRRAVKTHLVRMGNENRVYDFVRRELEAGHQAYLVYPAIGDGDRGFRSAEEMYRQLADKLQPFSVGLAHSQLDDEERNHTMERFASGEIHALVATSVVEVGVDVPNATCMVIEHAEVFGLAALHQLRGRVGRGNAQGYCMLVYQEPLTEDGRERLRVLFETTDGFQIAEEDLRIRGPGELQGSRQSGFLEFRFADIRRDMAVMVAARKRVAETLRTDPELTQPQHAALRRAVEGNEEAEEP